MEILVGRKYTAKQVSDAELKAQEFRRNKYTSGCANLDDMIALEKAVILCEVHARKFSPKAARYAPHPDKKLRQVFGNCDVCNDMGLSRLFLCLKDAEDEHRKVEKFKRALEYGHLVNG